MFLLTILINTSTCLGVGLQGDPVMSTGMDSSYIASYRKIATNIIMAAFFLQATALIIVVARNSPKAKKMTISLIISTAVTGIILSMI